MSENTNTGDGSPDPEPMPDAAESDVRNVDLDGPDEEDTFWQTYGGVSRGDRNPEETLSGPVGQTQELENISRAELREHYGLLRTFFKRRESLYTSFQRQLTQARVRQTYDQFLAAVVGVAFAIGFVGIALGVVVAGGVLLAAEYGALPAVLAGTGVPPGSLAATTFGVSALAGVLGGLSYWLWHRILRIRQTITQRRREINYNLPSAVTFMYALAQADVPFDRIVTRLADSPETYGAVAEEFDRVVRDEEMFGNNLHTGLDNLRRVTPSAELRRLTDDLMTVLETGGDLAAFLRDEVDDQLETAVAEQETFIGRLELLSEVFVVGFVAAPLFVLIVLIVIGFLGAETLTTVAAIVYVVIPLAVVAFAVFVDVISEPFVSRAVSSSRRDEASMPPEATDDPEWRAAFVQNRRRLRIRNWLRDQLVRVRDEPWRALLFSLPLGLALPALAVLTGVLPFGYDALLAAPVAVTTELVVVPVVVALLPVAAVYEYGNRQERAFQRRFPDLLELLATSNRRGLSLTRSLAIIAESASGRLEEELRKLRNDITWNADVADAFTDFGDRVNSPTVTRTAHLIAEGSRATSDLHVVLNVAATDTAERARLERERRQTLQSYLVIVIIGFLVYLLVMILLASSFLDPIETFAATAEGVESGPINPATVPVDELRVVLFHSALIQGFGSGVLAGKLAENSLYSGLKYGIGLTVLTVVVFVVV